MIKIVLLTLVISVVVNARSVFSGKYNSRSEYTRVKRAKYYSSPPLRYYRRPPSSYPVKDAFSYTPPPGYMMDDVEPQYRGFRPSKVSRNPINDGLGDEDINNMIKYLSKQDLDKIIKMTNERYTDKAVAIEFSDNPYKINKAVLDNVRSTFSASGPNINEHQDSAPIPNFIEESTQPRIVNNNVNSEVYSNAPFDTQESNQVSINLNSYMHQEINSLAQGNDVGHIITDSKVMKEEDLPKPLNLRDNDYEISFSNDVPVTINANGYKVESFADLPLMNYSPKLRTVSSYKVPHYTVTSSSRPQSPPSSSHIIRAPPVEPAPPASVASQQSDAHLKAIKIWTHRSKGAAYTLHDDGTLSVERPIPPKPKYGYP